MLATPEISDGSVRHLVWIVLLGLYTLLRTVRPVPSAPGIPRAAALVVEAGFTGLACANTGYFESPFVFSTLTAVSVAGFLAGFGMSLRLAAASTLAIGLPWMIDAVEVGEAARSTIIWGGEMLLVAVVASYARRITVAADERHIETLDRLGRLGDANELLYSLHEIAQDLPSSLDLDEVLDSTISRLRELVEVEAIAVVLHEETDGSWQVARRYGARLPTTVTIDDMPTPFRQAITSEEVVSAPNLLRIGGPGLSPRAGSGIYAPLVARSSLVGVIVLEHPDAFHFDIRATDLVGGFTEAAALAVDNARWFTRLRTVGADEERTRIARDLHDRIGQSLAYLAFELDRIIRKEERGGGVSADLDGLREDVRSVVREVRDTLYDLRTDVSEDRTVGEVLQEFTERVGDRSGIAVNVRVDESARIPQLQERELWRIAQEAIVNAERHSEASRIDIFWFSNGAEAVIEVRDDGSGMPAGQAGRLDSYGMLGMRERASSIGANLSVDSTPQRGVTVRATLGGGPRSSRRTRAPSN